MLFFPNPLPVSTSYLEFQLQLRVLRFKVVQNPSENSDGIRKGLFKFLE